MSAKFSEESADQIIFQMIQTGAITFPEVDIRALGEAEKGYLDVQTMSAWIAFVLQTLKAELMADSSAHEKRSKEN